MLKIFENEEVDKNTTLDESLEWKQKRYSIDFSECVCHLPEKHELETIRDLLNMMISNYDISYTSTNFWMEGKMDLIIQTQIEEEKWN